MNKTSLLLRCCFTLLCLAGMFLVMQAQVIISGRVTDDNDQPLSQANVFVNGSTLGTITKADGSFSLNIGKGGFIELVISHVGFEPLLYRAEMPAGNKRYVFRLVPKMEVLRNVVVLSSDMRKKWLAIFREQFLGLTLAGKQCKILNEDDIIFESGGKGVIKASSDVPLVVVNRQLGYKVYFQLVDFSHGADLSYFVGFSRYEELNSRTHKTKAGIRKKYYLGSSAHFFDALIRNNLQEEGFSLRLLRSPKQTADTVQPVAAAQTNAGPTTPVRIDMRNVVYSLPVSVDSIITRVDSSAGFNQYLLSWKGKLQVFYNRDPYAKTYLKQNVLLQGANQKGIESLIEMVEAPALMDETGSLANPLALQFGGFWGYEKLGGMLPSDYLPD